MSPFKSLRHIYGVIAQGTNQGEGAGPGMTSHTVQCLIPERQK